MKLYKFGSSIYTDEKTVYDKVFNNIQEFKKGTEEHGFETSEIFVKKKKDKTIIGYKYWLPNTQKKILCNFSRSYKKVLTND